MQKKGRPGGGGETSHQVEAVEGRNKERDILGRLTPARAAVTMMMTILDALRPLKRTTASLRTLDFLEYAPLFRVWSIQDQQRLTTKQLARLQVVAG